MSARDVYNSSIASAETQFNETGLTGNGTGPLNGLPNNVTVKFPSTTQLRAALALGSITQSQYVSLATASACASQCQARAARDILVNGGDLGPA